MDRWPYAHGHTKGRGGETEKEGRKGEVDRWPYAHGLTEEEGKEEKGGGPMALRPRTHQEKGRGRKGRWTDGLTPTDSPKGEKEEKKGGEGVQKALCSRTHQGEVSKDRTKALQWRPPGLAMKVPVSGRHEWLTAKPVCRQTSQSPRLRYASPSWTRQVL